MKKMQMPKVSTACFIVLIFSWILTRLFIYPVHCLQSIWVEHRAIHPDHIVVRLIDFNLIQKAEVIGSHYININRLIKEA